jgi:hypothetical protein
LLAPTANAADTTVSFTLSSGSLAINAPLTANLTGATLSLLGATASGQLGTTTVTDSRGGLVHVDTVNMSSGNFTDATSDVINASNVTGYSGNATVNGVGVAAPTAAGLPLSGAGSPILVISGVTGAISATFNPTVSVSIPSNAVPGTYQGTITQTVS